MRQHLFAVLSRNILFFDSVAAKIANFNKPFPEKGSLSGFIFNRSKSGGLFQWE